MDLMSKTGKDFDMSPETFTLANLFSMELHNYQDTIAEIVTSAMKELSIERVGKGDQKKKSRVWLFN